LGLLKTQQYKSPVVGTILEAYLFSMIKPRSQKLFLNFILILLVLPLQAAVKHVVAGDLPALVDTPPEAKFSVPLVTDFLSYESDPNVKKSRYLLNNIPVGLALEVVQDEKKYIRIKIPKKYQTCIAIQTENELESRCPETGLIAKDQLTQPEKIKKLIDDNKAYIIHNQEGSSWGVGLKDREFTPTIKLPKIKGEEDETAKAETEATIESDSGCAQCAIQKSINSEHSLIDETFLTLKTHLNQLKDLAFTPESLKIPKNIDDKDKLKEYLEDKYKDYSQSEGVEKTVKYLSERVGTWGHIELYKDKNGTVKKDYLVHDVKYTDSNFCWGALKRGMVDAGRMFSNYPPNSPSLSKEKKVYPVGNADTAGYQLQKAGFVNIYTKESKELDMTCNEAPRGAICHYECVNSGDDCPGHTEMRTETGVISSYDSTKSRTGDASQTGTRRLIGVYVKDIQ
jgi:hypothetical protein